MESQTFVVIFPQMEMRPTEIQRSLSSKMLRIFILELKFQIPHINQKRESLDEKISTMMTKLESILTPLEMRVQAIFSTSIHSEFNKMYDIQMAPGLETGIQSIAPKVM